MGWGAGRHPSHAINEAINAIVEVAASQLPAASHPASSQSVSTQPGSQQSASQPAIQFCSVREANASTPLLPLPRAEPAGGKRNAGWTWRRVFGMLVGLSGGLWNISRVIISNTANK